jgi:hypothetical protein
VLFSSVAEHKKTIKTNSMQSFQEADKTSTSHKLYNILQNLLFIDPLNPVALYLVFAKSPKLD